jgi:ATP-binding cassette subfamily B multidrug efflux pump
MKDRNASRPPLNVLSRVIALSKPYKAIFALTTLLAIVLAPLSVVRPYLIKVMVDDHIALFDISGLSRLMIFLVLLLISEAVLQYLFQYGTTWLGQSVVKDLRVRVFRHISNLRLSYFDKTPIGTSTTRTINDIEAINAIFSEGIITIIADLLSLIAVLGIMFYTSWKLTLICMITLPFLVVAAYIFKEKVRASFQVVRTQIARMNAFMQERITGMRFLQIFNTELREAQKFRVINRAYTKANLDGILYYAVFFPVVEIIAAASLGLMVWWGAGRVLTGDVTLGVLVAFPIYINMLFRPIRMLADKFNTLQMGLVASERVFSLLDRHEFIQNEGKIRPEHFDGEIEFQKVSFAYEENEHVLRNVSFKLEAGKTLAIVGGTGSGKSTVISLLNRFYDYREGHIMVDGKDIRDYELHAYRKRIALVLQDVFLFSGTVFENITLRDESISMDKVIASAKMIGAHDFIEKMPGGYGHQVMERGATLSMGQRQLISFVRALVFDPDILILDEATSSIDTETESVIQFAIETLISKRTSIIIAHRLSTIRHADKVLVLEKGRVAEFGSPENLLQSEHSTFRKLHELQFLPQSDPVGI